MANNTEQYNGEDIYCTDGYIMVTRLKLSKIIFVTGYRKDLFNDVWVQQWVISKRG